MENSQLKGKVAVITGAGSGIGRAIALLFADEGAKTVASDWNGETLDEVVQSIRKKDYDIIGIRGNVAVQAETEKLIDTAVSHYGRLDILCNNAGVMDHFHGVSEVSDEMWQRVLGINLNGPMFACRRAIPVMLKQGNGSIINIASMAGLGGGSAGGANKVSKHGLIGLTESIAWMYASQGVRCNAICPGRVKTSIKANSIDEKKISPEGSKLAWSYIAISPKILEPTDIAELALFLASDKSRYINGAVIPADGGWSSA